MTTVAHSETPTRKFSSDEAERDGLFRLFQTATKLLNRGDCITDRSRQSSPRIALGSVQVGVSDGSRVVGFEWLKERVHVRSRLRTKHEHSYRWSQVGSPNAHGMRQPHSCDCQANHVSWPAIPQQQRTQAMPTITGHFEAVVRGEQHCVSFIFDGDDKEGCYECIEVAVCGLTLKPGERKRLVSKAFELAAHRLWRGPHGRAVSGKRHR
jgi:hypothetical protein